MYFKIQNKKVKIETVIEDRSLYIRGLKKYLTDKQIKHYKIELNITYDEYIDILLFINNYIINKTGIQKEQMKIDIYLDKYEIFKLLDIEGLKDYMIEEIYNIHKESKTTLSKNNLRVDSAVSINRLFSNYKEIMREIIMENYMDRISVFLRYNIYWDIIDKDKIKTFDFVEYIEEGQREINVESIINNLKQCKNMDKLYNINDVRFLINHNNIDELTIDNSIITSSTTNRILDKDIKHLINLRVLRIKDSKDFKGECLRNFPLMEELEIINCKDFNEENLKYIREMSNLKVLRIESINTVGKFLTYIKSSLEELSIIDCNISDKHKDLIYSISSLKKITIQYCNIDDIEFDRLKYIEKINRTNYNKKK